MKKNISKKIFVLFILVTVVSVVLIFPSCQKKQENIYEFVYASGNNDYSSKTYYTDKFFEKSSTEYNPSLATATLSLSMASFSSKEKKQITDYNDRYKNAENFLKKIGFTDIDVNEDYKRKPDSDSFGVILGKKVIGDYTLIAVGTRGANYEREWMGNLTLGTGEDCGFHIGFNSASETLVGSLKDYLAKKTIVGKIKIWIGGFSRAGAACNIAVGLIDEELMFGRNPLSNNVVFTKEDIYAYCFEAPNGVPLDRETNPKSENFNNIFNIVNYNDPVAKLAPKEYGFTRYGRDIYLPDRLTDADFEKHIEVVKNFYNSLANSKKLGEYKIDDFAMRTIVPGGKLVTIGVDDNYVNWTQGLYLDNFINVLSTVGIRSREEYSTFYETGLRMIMGFVNRGTSIKDALKELGISFVRQLVLQSDVEVLIDDVLHNQKRLLDDVSYILNDILIGLELDFDKDTLQTTLSNLAGAVGRVIMNDLTLVFPLASKENLGAIISGHYPELCLAFMRAMDPAYTDDPIQVNTDGAYYHLTYTPELADILGFDLEIKRNGKTVVLFQNGSPVKVDGAFTYGMKNGTAEIYLPASEHYEITTSSSLLFFSENFAGASTLMENVQGTEADGYYVYNL